ncbi:protein PELOTA 1-like isoform X1 [Carex rostrata]
MWHAYNLICPGDTVEATTVRKVVRDMGSGGRDAERVRMMLEIRVEAVDYYKEGSVLRVRGKNFTQNEHVKIGQFHTLELELHRPFVISKKIWDSIARDILHEACDHAASVDLSVILMQEGLAQLFMVGRSITTARSRIETSIPRNSRKHGPAISGYESALKKFFENVLQALLMHIDFSIIRCVVIASPGFTKDQFRDYLLMEAQRQDLKTIIKNKSRIIVAHATSGYTHSLKDVLQSPNVMNLIKDTKAAKEVRALKDFFTMLSQDSSRACYGPRHVEFANERLAVETLLITENIFRNSDVGERQRYVRLVESVKDSGGSVHIFSSLHISGEQLEQLTGIAALLRFPLPELDDLEM